MLTESVPEALWPRISEFVAAQTGLHFPPERETDLQRGFAEAAVEFGFADAAACARWLLSLPSTAPELQTLAGHLTIGETYFFRERKTFDALAQKILPELIRRRRGSGQRLRLWSAACSTGEEAYSLAILLHELLPDRRDWDVTILATDINKRSLKKAVAGVYGEWSFRESPPEFKERYFTKTADRYAVAPEIRESVSFAQMNLAHDGFRSPAIDIAAMDVILCRNVLIYFTPSQARRLVEKLRGAMVDDAWLAVSPTECSQSLFSKFVAVNFPGTILYRKRLANEPALPEWTPAPPIIAEQTAPAVVALPFDPPAASIPELHPDSQLPTPAAATEGSDARALANEGRLPEALAAIERSIAADKLDAAAHYLHSMVLQELGKRTEARASLQRAVYLQPGFALAHFALGNCARGDARTADANKHFSNALRLLRGRPPDELVSESDGLTAGRLTEIISALMAQGELADESRR